MAEAATPDRIPAAQRAWWSEAVAATIQEMLAEQTKQLQEMLAEQTRQLQACFADETRKHEARGVPSGSRWRALSSSCGGLDEGVEQQLRGCVAEEVEKLKLKQASASRHSDAMAEVQQMSARHSEEGVAVGARRPLDPWNEDANRLESDLACAGGMARWDSAWSDSRDSVCAAQAHGDGASRLVRQSTKMQGCDGNDSVVAVDMPSQDSVCTTKAHGDHFSNLVHQSSSELRDYESIVTKPCMSRCFRRAIMRPLDWIEGSFEEPPRSGCLARLVTSSAFDTTVNVVISMHLIFMACCAEVNIRSPEQEHEWLHIGDVIFLATYTVEVTMKLLVHRQWLFCNTSWKHNTFDTFLVILGIVTLSAKNQGLRSNAGVLRVTRLLRAARVVRIGKVMANSRHLRSILVCIESSIPTIFWSLMMLFLVYGVFSLLLIELVVTHLQETGEPIEETAFDDVFGSLAQAMLTLFKASTGGDSWSLAYDVIQVTGALGICIYLFFISFTQFALINIITGIFVDAAIESLAPDPQSVARERSLKDKESANDLERFCRAVDPDDSGKLTWEQFQEGMQRKHIPLLLATLGLRQEHVLELFNDMAETADDGGRVEITTFVKGCMLLRGVATNFDLQKLHADLLTLHADSARHDCHMTEVLRLLRSGHDARPQSIVKACADS